MEESYMDRNVKTDIDDLSMFSKPVSTVEPIGYSQIACLRENIKKANKEKKMLIVQLDVSMNAQKDLSDKGVKDESVDQGIEETKKKLSELEENISNYEAMLEVVKSEIPSISRTRKVIFSEDDSPPERRIIFKSLKLEECRFQLEHVQSQLIKAQQDWKVGVNANTINPELNNKILRLQEQENMLQEAIMNCKDRVVQHMDYSKEKKQHVDWLHFVEKMGDKIEKQLRRGHIDLVERNIQICQNRLDVLKKQVSDRKKEIDSL